MACTCPTPPSYLPDASRPIYETVDGVLIRPVVGMGARFEREARDEGCPLHGIEAERLRAYSRRRDHLLSWRSVRREWPKSRRDAAAAIGVRWYEYADPNGDFYRFWPKNQMEGE